MIQEIIVGIIVVAAIIYLYKKFFTKKKGCKDNCDCH